MPSCHNSGGHMVRSCQATTAYQQVSAPLPSVVASCLLHSLGSTGQEVLASTSHPARQGTGLQPSPWVEGTPTCWPAWGCSYFESKTHRVQRGPGTSCPCSTPAPSSWSTSSASGLWDTVLRGSSTALCMTARRQLRHQTNPKPHQLARSLFFICNRKTLLKAGKTVMCFSALFLTLWCDGYHYGNDSFPPPPRTDMFNISQILSAGEGAISHGRTELMHGRGDTFPSKGYFIALLSSLVVLATERPDQNLWVLHTSDNPDNIIYVFWKLKWK